MPLPEEKYAIRLCFDHLNRESSFSSYAHQLTLTNSRPPTHARQRQNAPGQNA